MKRFKRLAALALSAVLAVGMMIPAGALQVGVGGGANAGASTPTSNLESHPGECSITITQATPGKAYFLYRLFDAKTAESGSGLVYTIDAGPMENPLDSTQAPPNYFFSVADAESSQGGLKDYIDFELLNLEAPDENLYQVEWQKGDMSEATAFAQRAAAAFRTGLNTAARALGEDNFASYLADYDYQVFGSKTADSDTVMFSNIPTGYYVIVSSSYILVTVDEINKTVSLEDKAVLPTVQKLVWENSYGEVGANGPDIDGAGWVSANDAAVGDTVWFKTTVKFGDLMMNQLLLEELVNMKRMTITNNLTAMSARFASMTLYDGMDAGLEWNSGSGVNGEGCVLNAYLRDAKTGALEELPVEFLRYSNMNVTTNQQAKDQYATLIYGINLGEIDDSMLEELVNLKRGLSAGGTNSSQVGLGTSLMSADFSTFGCMFSGYCSPQDEVILVYSAKVTPHAVVGENGNMNYTSLAGIRSSTTTYVHELDLVKTDSANNILPNSEFQLLDSNGNVVPLVYCNGMRTQADRPWKGIVFTDSLYGSNRDTDIGEEMTRSRAVSRAADDAAGIWINGGEGTNPDGVPRDLIWDDSAWVPIPGGEKVDDATGYYRVATPEEANAAGFVSAKIQPCTLDGLGNYQWNRAIIQGLDSGSYSLEETAAPDGYRMLSAPQAVELVHKGSGKVTLSYGGQEGIANKANITEDPTGTASYVSGGLRIINLSGLELPHTGGMGTTLFYVVGGVLVVGAGILLIVKKRMKNEE